MARALWGCLTLIALTPICCAQDTRSLTVSELKTAYCISALQLQLFMAKRTRTDKLTPGNADLMRTEIARTEETLKRLQVYLAPRIKQLDPTSLTWQKKIAEADVLAIGRLADECAGDCKLEKDDVMACLKASSCAKNHRDFAPAVRLEVCRNPDWLP